MKHNISIYIVLLSLLLISCKESYGIEKYGVFEGAGNINKSILNKDSAVQVTYQVHLPYPNTSVVEFYYNKLRLDGWDICQPQGEWGEQYKNDGIKTTAVRQLVNYAIHKKSSKLLMLSLQYYSKEKTNKIEDIEWNVDIQHVALISYEVDNLSKIVSGLSLTCL